MKVLVTGASGLIGSTVLRVLGEREDWEVVGTLREGGARRFFPPRLARAMVEGVDLEKSDVLPRVMNHVRPDVVINCAGMTKHKPASADVLASAPINTMMPHRLAALCALSGARLVHVSTDCVFSGQKGRYREEDVPDARDTYGRTKALGEVTGPNVLTVRTSTIGHELQSSYGLLNWFLSQEGNCKGYTRAIFSGLPTVVFAQVIRDVVIPLPELSGLYHVAGSPIAKYDLLRLIAEVYGKSIEIVPNDGLVIDRSLDAGRFSEATGYVAPDWGEMIKLMHAYR